MAWHKVSTKKITPKSKKRKFIIKLAVGVFLVLALFGFWDMIASTFWFSYRERTNLLISRGGETEVVGFDAKNKIMYRIDINPNLVIKVPGGFGKYPYSGILKLAKIEKDPQIIVRATEWMVATNIQNYFIADDPKSKQMRLKFAEIFSKTDYISNLRILDRLWWWWRLRQLGEKDFIALKTFFPKDKVDEGDRTVFSPERFSDEYEGYFFDSRIRKEDKKVIIVYSEKASAAENLARVLSGDGVRVVESKFEPITPKKCVIEYSGEKQTDYPRNTLSRLGKLADCDEVYKQVENADIRIILGEKLEKNWY